MGVNILWNMEILLRFIPNGGYIGIVSLAIGMIDSVVESVLGMKLFYGMSQNAGSNANASIICAMGIVLIAQNIFALCILICCVVVVVGCLRYVVAYRQCEKANKYVGKKGVAVGNIAYKGIGEFDGDLLKVRITHGKIEKGELIQIQRMDGFHLIVESIERPKTDYKEFVVNKETKRVPQENIIVVMKEKHTKYVIYQTTEGEFRERSTLEEAINGLDYNLFVMVDRSCAVNKKHVQKIDGRTIVMDNGGTVQASKARARQVKEDLNVPDIEVFFQFNGTRKTSVRNGYRAEHLIVENYLTTGVHYYFDTEEIAADGSGRGTITFITPELYPRSVWIGKKIRIQEGCKVVGEAQVIRVLNPVLLNKIQKICLEDVCVYALKNGEILNDYLKMFGENLNWIEEYTDGNVSSDTLCQIIKKAFVNSQYGYLLELIIDYIKGETITSDIFKLIIHFPDRKIRSILEVSLAHKKLSEQQLLYLCELGNNFECFYELAAKYYVEEQYSLKKFAMFIERFRNGKYRDMLEDLLEELIACYDTCSRMKREYVINLLGQTGHRKEIR